MDDIDPVVRGWLRGTLFVTACILARMTVVSYALDLFNLIILLLLLPSALVIQWHAIRPHVLMHPAIHRWTECDPHAFRTIRRIATILILTGLLPIALLVGLLLLLGHATLTLGTVPLPAPLVDASPIAADVRAAPATYRAAQSDPLGLNDIGRAPPIHITDAATAIATVTLALALWLIPVFADALAIGHMASGRIYPHDLAPHARGALPRAATPRAPPLTA